MRNLLKIGLILAAFAVAAPVLAQEQSDIDMKAIWNSLSAEEQAAYSQAGRDESSVWDAPAGTVGDTCAIAFPTSGALPFNDSNTTVGATDDYTYGSACGGFNADSGVGPDVAYLVQTSETCDLEVTMDPVANDLALWVVTDCSDPVAGCVAGDDSGGGGTAEVVGFTATAGTDYYVVVDGFQGASDDFTLAITETTATGCTLGTPEYNIGGAVSGLTGAGLVLQNNGGDDLAVGADGPFQFSTPVPDGDPYDVTVSVQPTGQTCSVTNGSGTVSGADVTNVQVDCVAASFSVGGTVSGLTGAGLVLQNNGGDDLAVGADGPFQFSTPVPDGDPYDVTVSVQPTGQTCSVTNGSGTVSGADVTDVVVDCGDIQIGVSTTSVDFPDAQVGESSGATVTVSNTGTGDLDISGITTAAPFAVTGGTCLPLPTTLTAGADCTIELTFSPVSEGDFAGTLEIVSNAATSPTSVSLSGSTSFVLAVPTFGFLGLVVLILALLGGAFVALRRYQTAAM